jgi:Glycosyl hydrolase family 26
MRRLLPALLLALLLWPGLAEARAVGVYVDPWHVTQWAAGVGERPDFVARFEAFSRGATLESFLGEAERQGLRRVLISWEPWQPVPTERGVVEQFRAQPGYRNRDIAAGAQDAYIVRFAQSLATFDGRVDLRYAHEMNGTWYPWSRDPIAYRRAWRHIVRLFRSAGARNVRFVWSPNPSLFVPMRAWRRSVRVYWPGRRFVDAVGATMINYGGDKRYGVRRFEPRLRALHRTYRKPVMLTEVKTEHRGRVGWLRTLRRLLRRTPWIRSVAWFQHSHDAPQQLRRGRLDWNMETDPKAAAVMRGIIRDAHRAPR